MTRHKRHRIKLRSMYQWHRYLGITAALFAILVSITGLMLNHTEDLQLDRNYVQSQWLLDWYGVDAPTNISGYRTGQYWISQWNDRLLTREHDLGFQDHALLGAVSYQGMLIIALEGTLILLNSKGEIVESLQGYQGVPAGMWAIGLTSDQRVAVKAAHGSYVADADLLNWKHHNIEAVRWSAPTPLPEPVYDSMLRLYRGKGLALERVLLDLHSGRLLSQGGVYFFDFIAVVMMFLACSGLWLWTVRLIKAHQHRKAHRTS